MEQQQKKTKNNYYNSTFSLGIPEDSSKDEDDTTPIKIFYKEKIATKINNKRNKKKDELNWNDKIYILKGAVIMIEDWWKEIKEKKKQKMMQ